MKKPWIIGLLSIVPGVGFIALGKIRLGFVVLVIVALFAFLGIFAPSENVSITGYTLAIIAWGTQLYYAVLVAQQSARLKAGLTPPVRPISIAPSPPGASSGERLLHKARQDVMQLLQPGEHLNIAIHGQTGAPSLISLLLFGPIEATEIRQVYLGATEHDFILVKIDRLGKPEKLQRIPLSQVKLVKSKQGWLSDEVVIDIGEAKPLRVRVGRVLRQGTQQLVGILSGTGLPTEIPYPVLEKPPAALQYSAGPSQGEKFDQGVQERVPKKASTFLLHVAISSIFLLIGYAIGFGVFGFGAFGIALMEDPFSRDVVGNIPVQIICCLPVLLPTACAIAALAVFGQSRLKISFPAARIFNGIASIIAGAVTYVPFQFLLLAGASL